MVYAIVENNGKQLWLELGRIYTTERVSLPLGCEFRFNRILLTNEEETREGGVNKVKIKIGRPYIPTIEWFKNRGDENNSLKNETIIKAKVLNHLQGKKLLIFKMKSKKKMKRTMGHRQLISTFIVSELT